MRPNRLSVSLPIVAGIASAPVDAGAGFAGFVVQFVGVGLAAGSSYALHGSIDGVTWIDLTHTLKDLVTGSTAGAPIGADSIFEYGSRFPGVLQFVCATAPTTPPANAPVAWVGYQDTTQA